MSQFHPQLDDRHTAFIAAQPMFFVASACAEGRVNVSPKGIDSFRVLGPLAAAYLDLTGSGNETAAHLLADGRITVMFCSFGETPMILRLFGRGDTVHPDDAEWPALAGLFPPLPGARQIHRIAIEQVQTSCGFAVPRMDLVAPRSLLLDWAEKKTADDLADYRQRKNALSIDGLPTR